MGHKNIDQREDSKDELEDTLTVFPNVTKYEVINFLVAYLKCI